MNLLETNFRKKNIGMKQNAHNEWKMKHGCNHWNSIQEICQILWRFVGSLVFLCSICAIASFQSTNVTASNFSTSCHFGWDNVIDITGIISTVQKKKGSFIIKNKWKKWIFHSEKFFHFIVGWPLFHVWTFENKKVYGIIYGSIRYQIVQFISVTCWNG